MWKAIEQERKKNQSVFYAGFLETLLNLTLIFTSKKKKERRKIIIKHNAMEQKKSSFLNSRAIIFRLSLLRFLIENNISRGDGLIVWLYSFFFFISLIFFIYLFWHEVKEIRWRKKNSFFDCWEKEEILFASASLSYFISFRFFFVWKSCEFISLQIDADFFFYYSTCTCFEK